ncbi:MAG: replicative DNA helicase [Clostridiales bacterium]|jgi:replicative DNA helicase|nr:replicative DNA helicase [Clostridiales bacterium]
MAQRSNMRVPPQSIEAEMSVLGCLLLDQEKISTVLEIIRPEDFYREEHRDIYLAILALFEKSEPIDILTVEEQLKSRGQIRRAGGMAYLGELAAGVPTPENARHYAGIVAQKSLLRKLIHECSKVVEDSYAAGEDAVDIVEAAESAIFGILENRNHTGVMHVRDVIVEALNRLEELAKNKNKYTGIQTGFYLLDENTLGLQKSDLILLAARPSMGKTALALNIAYYAAVRVRSPVIVFSLEMSREQLVNRMISASEQIDSGKLRSGRLSDEDWHKITDATGRMLDAPLYFDDTAGVTVADIKAKCRRLKLEQHGLGLVVIDYIQLMQGSGQGRNRGENRQQEISEISRSLKLMAKELDVPVLALSQLSRAPMQRSDHRPMLSDLRDSGAIEQDADIVMFIHRDEVYHDDTERPGIAELIIAKHRNGETGTIELLWQGVYTRFVNLAGSAGAG